MQEIWKSIPNLNGYLISNLGRVYSNKRKKIISQHNNEKGYLRVTLYDNKQSKVFRVHRLVAQTFLNNPNNYEEINHIDGNKHNNCVNNLEWCNHLHNMQEAFKNNLIPPRKSNKTSFKPTKVILCNLQGKPIKTFPSIRKASDYTGIDVRNISRYCKGQRKCKEYIWRYANE